MYRVVRPQYTNTLSDLVQITFESVEKYIAEAAIVTGISQRINAQVKIHSSIEWVPRQQDCNHFSYKSL